MIKKLSISLLNIILILFAIGGTLFFLAGVTSYSGDDHSVDTLFDSFPYFPECGIVDFVETENGIYIAVDYFKKIARYRHNGKLDALFHSPSRYSPRKTRLAADQLGNIYVKAPDGIYVCSPDLVVKSAVKNPENLNATITWVLEHPGLPVPRRGDSANETTITAVTPGKTIFTPYTKKRSRFTCHDGSVLELISGNLTRTSPLPGVGQPSGKNSGLIQVPWWIRPFSFPFPALLGWPLLLLWGLFFLKRRLVFYKIPSDRLSSYEYYIPPVIEGKPAQDSIRCEDNLDAPSIKSLIFRSPASMRLMLLPLGAGAALAFLLFYFIFMFAKGEMGNPKFHLEPGPLEIPFIFTIVLPLAVTFFFGLALVILGGAGNEKIVIDTSGNIIKLRKQFRIRISSVIFGADYGNRSYDLAQTDFLLKPAGKGLIPNPGGYLTLKNKLSREHLAINNNIEGKTKVLEFINQHSRETTE